MATRAIRGATRLTADDPAEMAKIQAQYFGMIHEVDAQLGRLWKALEDRGLWDDPLIIWGGEFGRTPAAENPGSVSPGRNHSPSGYTVWLAGGGVKGGQAIGATDDVGYAAIEKPVSPNDLHATILHLLGLNHEKLTYRYNGRDFRLTDVAGKVIREIQS